MAVLAKDLIAATALGGSEDLMNHLFLAGFFTAFFAGVFVIDDLSDAFGENEPVYFDNASDAAYRLIVNGQTATSIGAGEHMQVWMGLGWNDLAAHPTTGDGPVWCGRIHVEDSPGYLVFNVRGQNSYTVMTAAWGE